MSTPSAETLGESHTFSDANNHQAISPIRMPVILCPLLNLCNTCYFNSGTQLLANCASFALGLRDSPFRQPKFRHSAMCLCRTGGAASHDLFNAFAQLLHDMEFTPLREGDALSPLRALDCLAAVHPAFEGRGQQDCPEMVNVTIAAISEENRRDVELDPLLKSFEEDAGIKYVASMERHTCQPSSVAEPIDSIVEWSKQEDFSSPSSPIQVAWMQMQRSPGSWWDYRILLLMHAVNRENELLERKEKARRQQLYQNTFVSPKLFFNSATDCFKGYMMSEVRCHACGSTSRIIEEFSSLILDIPSDRQRLRYAREHPEARRLAHSGDTKNRKKSGSIQWWNPFAWFSVFARWFYSLITDFGSRVDYPITLQECLDTHFEPVLLKDSNKYHCLSCNTTSEATKRETLLSLPECLLIQMKRFKYGHCFNTKKTDPVLFPLSWNSGSASSEDVLKLGNYLHESVATMPSHGSAPTVSCVIGPNHYDKNDISHDKDLFKGHAVNGEEEEEEEMEIVMEEEDDKEPTTATTINAAVAVGAVASTSTTPTMTTIAGATGKRLSDTALPMGPQHPIHTYSLDAVVNHHGSIGGGHYTAYTRKRSADRDAWIYLSDDEISPVNVTDVADSEEYLLMYRKQPLEPRCDAFTQLQAKARDLLAKPHGEWPGEGPSAEEFVFIARPWLLRMATFEEPGPILNRLCYCNERQLSKPLKSQHSVHVHGPPVEWFYVPLLNSEFDAFYAVYGGNAALTQEQYKQLKQAQDSVCAPTP